jgi:hypothetical protein
MYIKSFKRYIKESMMDEQSDGEVLQFQLRDFNNKKNNLKNLMLNNIDSDKDISKNYADIVKENPFLDSYGNMLKVEVTIKRKEKMLEQYAEELNSLKNDTSLLGQMSDEDEQAAQQANIDDRVKDKNERIKEEEESIKKLQEKMRLMEEGLKEFISIKGEELKAIQKNVII